MARLPFQRAPWYVIVVFAVLCLAPSLSQAATDSVRADGNDACAGTTDAAGASGACAYRTIGKGASSAQPGDTVTIHAGSYGGFTTVRSGTSAGRITFTRAGSETVTVTGQVVVNHNYITLNGLTMTYSDSYEAGAALRGGGSTRVTNLTVTNCTISIGGSNAFGVVLNADDVLFDRNLMEGKPTFFIGIVHQGQRHTISNNIFRNVVDVERLFNVASSNSVWIGNEIYNFTWTGNGAVHPDIWQTINDGSVAQNNIIENNYVHDCPNVQLGNTETNSTGMNVSNWTWRNNVFANMSTLYIWTGNFKFYNNTFYRSSASNQSAVYLYQGTFGNGSGADFRNNIFLQETNQGIVNVASGQVTWTHSSNFVANTNFTARSGWTETGGINGGNPQFVAAFTNCMTNTCNFHIGSTSAAKDKGATLTAVPADKDGVTRPQGPAYDMGAYEYASGGTATSACDVNADNSTTVVDVQLSVNQALGVATCTADINKDGLCNVVDVQRVVNAALGGACQ